MSTRTEELLKYDAEHVLHSLGTGGKNWGFALESAEGVRVKDSEGKEYIDLSSQLINVNFGHTRKDIIEAAKAQLDKMQFTTLLRGFANVPAIEYSMKLAQVVPKGLDHFLFTMTGADADDCAFKIANRYHQVKGERRYKIISLFNGYHGTLRGTGGASQVNKGVMSECPPCGTHLHTPNYNCYRCPLHLEYPSCGIECAKYLDYLIENEGKDSVCCFIAEPEQGAGGFIAPPPEYFPMVREICSKHGVIFIGDEVMTGFGRTGKMWALENWNVVPDIMTMSKAIVAAYLPFGAVAVSQEIFDALRGQHLNVGSSETGNPICCAVASKVLDVMKEEHIVEHAAEMGKYAKEQMEKRFLPLSHIGSVSGLGLMLGMDIVVDKKAKATPAPGTDEQLMRRALEQGLYARVMQNRFCFAPPLVITKEEIDEALDKLYPVLAELKLS